jgi:hypothetical protein
MKTQKSGVKAPHSRKTEDGEKRRQSAALQRESGEKDRGCCPRRHFPCPHRVATVYLCADAGRRDSVRRPNPSGRAGRRPGPRPHKGKTVIARHFRVVINHCRPPLALFAALVYLSGPVLFGADQADQKDEKKGDNKAAIAQLTKDFKSSVTRGKLIIVEKFAKLGEGAARPLCDAMLDKDDKVATAALVALEKAHPTLYKPVVKLVIDDQMKNRAKALEEFSMMGADALPALGLLVARSRSALAEAKTDQRFVAVVKEYMKTISAIGPEERETVEFLKDAVESPIAQIREDALERLVAWAGDNEARRKEVLPLLKTGIALPGADALPFIKAAGRFGGLSRGLLPALKKLKLSGMAAVRDAATEAVEAIEKSLP